MQKGFFPPLQGVFPLKTKKGSEKTFKGAVKNLNGKQKNLKGHNKKLSFTLKKHVFFGTLFYKKTDSISTKKQRYICCYNCKYDAAKIIRCVATPNFERRKK